MTKSKLGALATLLRMWLCLLLFIAAVLLLYAVVIVGGAQAASIVLRFLASSAVDMLEIVAQKQPRPESPSRSRPSPPDAFTRMSN